MLTIKTDESGLFSSEPEVTILRLREGMDRSVLDGTKLCPCGMSVLGNRLRRIKCKCGIERNQESHCEPAADSFSNRGSMRQGRAHYCRSRLSSLGWPITGAIPHALQRQLSLSRT